MVYTHEIAYSSELHSIITNPNQLHLEAPCRMLPALLLTVFLICCVVLSRPHQSLRKSSQWKESLKEDSSVLTFLHALFMDVHHTLGSNFSIHTAWNIDFRKGLSQPKNYTVALRNQDSLR